MSGTRGIRNQSCFTGQGTLLSQDPLLLSTHLVGQKKLMFEVVQKWLWGSTPMWGGVGALNGPFFLSQDTLFVDGRAILHRDLVASNGIIHVISGPLKAPTVPMVRACSRIHSQALLSKMPYGLTESGHEVLGQGPLAPYYSGL